MCNSHIDHAADVNQIKEKQKKEKKHMTKAQKKTEKVKQQINSRKQPRSKKPPPSPQENLIQPNDGDADSSVAAITPQSQSENSWRGRHDTISTYNTETDNLKSPPELLSSNPDIDNLRSPPELLSSNHQSVSLPRTAWRQSLGGTCGSSSRSLIGLILSMRRHPSSMKATPPRNVSRFTKMSTRIAAQ